MVLQAHLLTILCLITTADITCEITCEGLQNFLLTFSVFVNQI